MTTYPNVDDIIARARGGSGSTPSLPRRLLTDPLITAAKGITGLGQGVVGLADLASGGYAGKALEDYAGYDAQRTNQILNDLYTPEQQAANQEVQNAQGFLPTVGAAIANPSTIAHGVIESLPMMIGGQAIASKLISAAPKALGVLGGGLERLAPSLAAADEAGITAAQKLAGSAIGEGGITAGSQAEQIRQQTPDRLLSAKQEALAAGSGLVTGAVTALSGGLGSKFGIEGDIDTAFLGRNAAQTAPKSLVNRTLRGGATEGVEELVQSGQEQAATNLALDKPIGEGVGNAAATGMLMGFGQGAPTAALFHGSSQPQPIEQAALPAPEANSPLSRAVTLALPVIPALPNLPADEIITFADGSQSRASDTLKQLIDSGHKPEDAQAIVANLVSKAKTTPTKAEAVQSTGQPLPSYQSVMAASQKADTADTVSPSQYARQNFINGLLQDNPQPAQNGLTQEKTPLDLLTEAKQAQEDKAQQAKQEAIQSQPVVFKNERDFFSGRHEAAAYARQNGLDKSYTPTQAWDGAWVLRNNAHQGSITARNINDFLPRQQPTTTGIAPTLGGADGSLNPNAPPATGIDTAVTASPNQVGSTGGTKPAVKLLAGLQVAELQNQTVTPKQAVKPQAIKEDDNLLTAIAKLGGLSSDHAKAQGIDPAAMNSRVKVFGKSNVFTKNGRSYDDLAETLAGHGYEIADANDLVDQVSRAINHGEKIHAPRGSELVAERELSAEQADRFAQETSTPAENDTETSLSDKANQFAIQLPRKRYIDLLTGWTGIEVAGKNKDDLFSMLNLKKGEFSKKDFRSALGRLWDSKKQDRDARNKGFADAKQQAKEDSVMAEIYKLSGVNPATGKWEASNQRTDTATQNVSDKPSQGLDSSEYGNVPFRRSVSATEKPKGITLESAQAIADEFMRDYNGNIPLKIIVVENQEDIYGADNTRGKFGVIKGGYHPASKAFVLVASNMDNKADTTATIRHEILAHYGLNTFKSEDKRAILDKIIASENHPSLAPVWQEISSLYKDETKLVQAEEVFAKIAEDKRGFVGSVFDRIAALINKALRSIGLVKSPLSQAEIRRLITGIGEGIKRGERVQQTFPKSDNAQFRLADTVTDYFTGNPRRTTTLDDIDTMIDTFRQPKDMVGWQYYFDKAVTTFTDSTRPFARFVQDTFDSAQASKLLSGADRALGMKAAYEKEAMNLFGRHIADGIRDIMKHVKPSIKGFVSNSELYKTAKDMTGYWMTAKYSIDANNWLMEKDQTAIDELNSQIAKTTDPDELKALNKQLAKAKDTQTKRIAAINDPAIIDPTKQKQDAGLAGGFNHATAKEYMAKIETKIPLALLDKTANYVYDMNQWKLKRDIADGKISQATADKFPQYRHYVPLTGDPRVDDSVEDHFATGSVNQAKDKAIGGRTGSIAQNGIDASFEQLEKSARYHGWNDFKTALTETYDKLIADKIASGMKQKEAEQAVADEFDIKRRPETGMIPAGENDITVRKDGKGFIYTINNQAAMEALRSVNNEDIPSILKPIAAFTRFQARMVTQFMPLFAPTNMIRDVAERSENIRTRKIAGHPTLDMNKVANQAIGQAVKLLTQLKPVMMGVLAENTHLAKLFPVDNTNPDVILLKQFLALGGSSTYGDMLSGDSKSLAEKLRKTGTFSDKAMEVIELWNNSFETISGFSIYKSLVANGVSDKDAATASLNLMNFGKRGRVMSPLRALYMFAQPIATGGHQLAMTLGTRRGQVRYAVYTIAAMALYAMLRSGDDDDELGINKMDELGNFTLYRNIPIPLGNGQYFKVPVGFGMQQLAWAHGVNAVRTLSGQMTAGEAIAESAGLWARSAMPVAPAETSMMKNPMVWFAQTFSPQIAKPIVNIAMDVNSFGAPLTNARYERQDKAKALQGRRDTPQVYKDISQEFARHGIHDFYPEEVREFMRDYMAGVGNEALKWAVENPAKTARGLDVSSPLIDRYVMQTNDDSLRQRLYYRARDRMNELEVRKSTGDTLTAKEEQLVSLGDKLKTLESRARGKSASATKAEKLGQDVKAKNLRAQAERGREDYINYALSNVKNLVNG